MRKPFLSIILASSLSLGGCASLTQGSLTHKVTIAQHNFLQVVNGFEDAEIAEHSKGATFIPDDVHVKIQGIIQKIALGGKDLDAALASGADATTIRAKINIIYTLLNSLDSDGLTGIKSPSSKALLEVALNQIKAVLDLSLTQVS